jgi:hypothetical protein
MAVGIVAGTVGDGSGVALGGIRVGTSGVSAAQAAREIDRRMTHMIFVFINKSPELHPKKHPFDCTASQL